MNNIKTVVAITFDTDDGEVGSVSLHKDESAAFQALLEGIQPFWEDKPPVNIAELDYKA